ncbi:hypothetical protein [Halobacillus litoralis]|uniref:hypothetical protein n=1 Tax=Halobacillus litoralis TaxID=45668 RepID=UPI001CD79E61|nr:hypothetical protein [Halobacillus litoralis]MCA1022929.1 hypothetical protein [Halobacillus litoralis]
MLKNFQGAVLLPLLRKNDWAGIAERGFCEEARTTRPRKGKGLTLPAVRKKKAGKETGVSLPAEEEA